MLAYYRNTIIDLISKLRSLRQNLSNLDLLIDIQNRLTQKIIYIEGRIDKCKGESTALKKALSLSRLPKQEAKKLKARRNILEERVKQYQWLLFVFRTIGDGIAFLYLDKWDIKPLAFKGSSPSYKEDVGYISGKSGKNSERALLLSAIAYNVPAILTDLTNSIKHGDICLLGEAMPRLIEVKTSQNKNARVIRQTKELAKVQSYLDKDEGEHIRGLPYMQRFDMHAPETTHTQLLNNLFAEALKQGSVLREVEAGVYYYVMTPDAEIKLDKFSDKNSILIPFFLNDAKNEGNWISYYPFTLSIEHPENVYRFLKGDIIIVILIDFRVIEKFAESKGFTSEFIDRADISVIFTNTKDPSGQSFFAISTHFLSRVAFEFTSLEWLLNEAFAKQQLLKET